MDSKKTQRLSKATVATVLAASGVVVAMPQPTNAYTFSDLNPYADYYEPILDLANRKIATGYSDGTFKPNEAITREDAAKMLALTLDVNISNPANPRFSDVAMSNPNYRYIAALAEAGIINGYTDGTFKPKEPITRGQMAKILTLGFKFGVSSKIKHGFDDVTEKSANAYFIQTLVDLKVTKGTTGATFSPFKTVTRGQMATFISRAEKADKGNPTYTVGEISGDKVYINGVAYTVASHLRSIISPANKNILKGALIEGTYSGNTLSNISKLTINASGTSTRLLALDGNYTSFAGELVIHGNYLRMKNINFTGTVEVADAPRRSLAAIQNIRFASTGNFAQFIDWGKPNESVNENFLNPIEKETLQDKPDPDKPAHLQPYKERMANIQHYVDFDQAEVRHLYVSGDRSFIKSDDEFDRITVRDRVTNFELYADANALYIDTDYNVTVYGEHDIKYVYKNTLKNIYFNTDSMFDYYYVTTGSGYTDLGIHAYIDKAIIPPGKTVNDIFDDYKTDNPNIGWVEDEDGTAVDRDPVENTVIVDETPPRITRLDVKAGGTIADVTLTADEDGTYYYIVQESSLRPPSISDIKTGGKELSGSGPLVMDQLVKFQVTGLDSLKDYTIYAIVIDAADNVSDKKETAFKTIDSRPPTFRVEKGETMYGGKRLEFILKNISEAGKYYYYIREKSSAPDPTVSEIIEKHTGTGVISKPGDITIRETQIGAAPNKEAIRPNTDYEIYAVMVDDSGNQMRDPAEKLPIKSEGPDEVNPYVLDTKLELSDKEKGYFYITVSEELDKATAENPANYLLSGTGIVNITGHKEIQPVEVQYSNKRIRLTIPAVSSLVNGDTIVATVLEGVKDLAENEFENIDTVPVEQIPRNYAQYDHTDALTPTLDIKNIITGTNKYEVEVQTNKAGTYYYMILPEGYDFTTEDITNRDFVDEFSSDSSVVTGKFQTTTPLGTKDDYIQDGQGPSPLGTYKFDITKPVPPILDPFTSYRLYMVLKDRSGQLSKIMDRPLISDSKPPLITGIAVENIADSDTSVKVSFNVDEKANFYALPVRKYVIDPATGMLVLNSDYFDGSGNLKNLTDVLATSANSPDLFDKFKALGGREYGLSTGQGNVSFNVTGLIEHEEYGMYIGAVDSIGNFTILQRSSDPVLSEDEPKGDEMKVRFYTDGTKPIIDNDGVIVRKGELTDPNPTFTITFSEAIMRQNDASGATNYNKTTIPSAGSFDLSSILEFDGANIADYEFVSYTVGTATKEKSKLVIRAKNSTSAQQTFRVKMKEDAAGATVYDYKDQNGFDTTKIGTYEYPTLKNNRFTLAKLIGSTNGVSSKQVEVIVEMTVDLGLRQNYYYATIATTDTRIPTAQAIMNAVASERDSTGLIVFGKGTLEDSTNISQELNLITGNINPTDTFIKDQKLYLFTFDKYGNIIWANDGTNDYIRISN